MHYNTTEKKNQDLKKAQNTASSQDKRVYEVARHLHNLGTKMTARRIWEKYQQTYGQVHLTSVRRSINTLVNSYKLHYKSGLTTRFHYIEHKCPVNGTPSRERQITL